MSDAVQGEIDIAKTIFLVFDDKAFFRDMVHTALTRAGAKDVKHATTIEHALELLNRHGQHIGCVIADWDISPVGGLELLRMIRCRSLAKTPARTAMVILTARADAAAVKSAMAMDVNGFAVAPLSFEKLIKTVTNALARTWTLQAASVYGSVPTVTPTLAAPEKSAARTAHAPGTGKPFARRPTGELKNVHMCILADVRPGEILARDLVDRGGHLLLKTGTELKSSLIERLKSVAHGHTESYHLWVGEREASPS